MSWWIKCLAVWAAAVMLVGCDVPSRHFQGAAVTRIAVDGSRFDVRRRGRLAEAVRVNSQYAPRLGPIARRAEIAIELATGCPVREIRGDAAVVLGILDCGGDPGQARIAKTARSEIECDVVDVWTPAGGDTTWIESEC